MSCATWCEGILIFDCFYTIILLLLQTEVQAQKYQVSCVREMVELCDVV